MTNNEIITKTADFVQQKLQGEGTGHDWWHVWRVWQMAKKIADNEPQADRLTVELAALLHDIADWKFVDGDLEVGPKAARDWLASLHIDEEVIAHIADIIRDTSFKGAKVDLHLKTLEAKIIFDADKLDAMGAIAIARTFAYGGRKNRPIYEPELRPVMHASFEEYRADLSHSINHFYEKLLLLKDLMQTETGKKMANHRHKYMEEYLDEFFKEWNGEF